MENEKITKEYLEENGVIIETALEGTCQLWQCQGAQYVVLTDNTVITREDDEKSSEGGIFGGLRKI